MCRIPRRLSNGLPAGSSTDGKKNQRSCREGLDEGIGRDGRDRDRDRDGGMRRGGGFRALWRVNNGSADNPIL